MVAPWSPCTVRQGLSRFRLKHSWSQTCWPSLPVRPLYPHISTRSRPKECPGHMAKSAPTQERPHHHAAGWASQALAERGHHSLALPLGKRIWSCCCQAGKGVREACVLGNSGVHSGDFCDPAVSACGWLRSCVQLHIWSSFTGLRLSLTDLGS